MAITIFTIILFLLSIAAYTYVLATAAVWFAPFIPFMYAVPASFLIGTMITAHPIIRARDMKVTAEVFEGFRQAVIRSGVALLLLSILHTCIVYH